MKNRGAWVLLGIAGLLISAGNLRSALNRVEEDRQQAVEERQVGNINIYEDNEITIVYTEKTDDTLKFEITNNSETAFDIICDDVYIDDVKRDIVLGSLDRTTIEPGKTANKRVEFYEDIPEEYDKIEVKFVTMGSDENDSEGYFTVITDTGLIELK